MSEAPTLSAGYNDDGIILYREDENGEPLMLALMDTTAAIKYARDLCDMAEHLMKATEDFVAHMKLVDDVNDALNGEE